jgi:hypothetical protein
VITAESILVVLAYLFVGSVLHRAMAARLLRFDGLAIATQGGPSERDLLFLGLGPALVLVGVIGTYLALFHLFRADVMIAVLVVAVLWRRRDAAATAGAVWSLIAGGGKALRQFDILTLGAIAAFIGLAVFLFVLAQLPSSNPDVWVFQFPLAQSMVEHSGFVYPQIDHPFYGNNPLFFNLLFAEALLAVDHFIAANTVNIAIYLSFMLAVLTYAARARGAGLLLIIFMVASSSFFSPAAPTPLTDLPRSCFSVLALLFTDRYLRDSRLYDLVVAGLLAGAAAAGKYTELVTAALIGVCLLPGLVSLASRRWIDACAFSVAVVIVGAFWYVKNWILLGNPIYPFLLGHPGLSDQWMAEYIQDISRAFDPADRIYNTNLLTLQGWRDFGYVLYDWFLARHFQVQVALVLAVSALVSRPRRMAMLSFCTVALFVIWYAVMFNHIRFAMPAYLLFLSTAFVGATVLGEARPPIVAATKALAQQCVGRLRGKSASAKTPAWANHRPIVGQSWSTRWRLRIAALVAMLLIGAGALWSIPQSRLGLADILLGRTSIDEYLSSRREGYAIYRYIAQHDLRMVFQPLDNGAVSSVPAYNGGRDGHWILPFNAMPTDPIGTDKFVDENHIRFFIYRPWLDPVAIDRLGADHVASAYRVFEKLLPKSRLLMADPFGWSLYEIQS